MAMINIRRDVDDVFYRYKMHPVQSKVSPEDDCSDCLD
jgi:hypothetical protein